MNTENQNFDVSKKASGAISLDLNWLLFQGFYHYETPEFLETADHIKAESLKLLTKNGFYQYFKPHKKEVENAGLGSDNCPISASILLNWLL